MPERPVFNDHMEGRHAGYHREAENCHVDAAGAGGAKPVLWLGPSGRNRGVELGSESVEMRKERANNRHEHKGLTEIHGGVEQGKCEAARKKEREVRGRKKRHQQKQNGDEMKRAIRLRQSPRK